MRKFLLMLAVLAAAGVFADDIPGVPRDSNLNNTGGYESTRIQAQLQVKVADDTRIFHFIRDNNDPRVVTKTYLIKNVDAYEFRDFLRQMVQAKRVGNTALQQDYPGNAYATDGSGNKIPGTVAATVSSPELSPTAAQPGYVPAAQLGSNTAVECIKYADGTGLLIISAEDYRFRDHDGGMGIDSLVAFLDKPQMGACFGTQTFFYLPKFVPARNLMPLIQNVGMNINDVTEAWQGQDLVAYDPDLNWLIFDVSNYSCDNISLMLMKYDVPIPQVRMRYSVYEVTSENDEKIGIDFQNWKNNEGANIFSAGGRYRNNWSATYSGGMSRDYGSERTSFYNFNPKWNSRYLDFLVSKGRARVAYTGELLIRNNTPAKIERLTQIFYDDVSNPVSGAVTSPDMGVGPYEMLSALIGRAIPNNDIPVGKGEAEITTRASGFGFTLTVANAAVNLDETRLKVTMSNTSLLGFESSGAPRISAASVVTQDVSLPHGKDVFVIGGLKKQEVVKSTSGVPWLMDIPWIGYLFSTESTSVKYSELVLAAQCDWASPGDELPPPGSNLRLRRDKQ
ncbi:MAG: type II secretion system protein GspD [Victivallaceae bacterium]|nr:hypothetical protein [Victivallaceae bacterium]